MIVRTCFVTVVIVRTCFFWGNAPHAACADVGFVLLQRKCIVGAKKGVIEL